MQDERDHQNRQPEDAGNALDEQMQKYIVDTGQDANAKEQLTQLLRKELDGEEPALQPQMLKYVQDTPQEPVQELTENQQDMLPETQQGEGKDLFSHNRPEQFLPRLRYNLRYRLKPYFAKDNHRQAKRWALFGGMAAVVTVFIAVALMIGSKMHGINSGVTGDPDITAGPEDDLHIDEYYEISDADSLNEMLYLWQNNKGQLLSSKNVINILLVGVDSKSGDMSGGRSDVIMIASLNKLTQKITLLSVLRDSYVYMRINDSDRYDKLNHSFMWAGPEGLQATLESLYKIKIDNYVCVDFATFPKLIDALGGVSVPVTQEESNFLRNKHHQSIPAGESVKLNGSEALLFCRIRKLSGGDDQRARRQRDLIESLIQRSEEATVTQLGNAVQTLLPNIRSDMNTARIVSLGTEAITSGWMRYARTKMTSPSEESRKGTMLQTYSSPFLGNRPLSVWVVDFPSEARAVQLALYGQTNITIPENYTSPLGLLAPTTRSATVYVPPQTAVGSTGPTQSGTQPTQTPPPVSTTNPPPVSDTEPSIQNESTLPTTTQPQSTTLPPTAPPESTTLPQETQEQTSEQQ